MEKLKIDKPIRLIELFAGVGSQAKALSRLGANFEHYRVCEFDKYCINSYNAIHGTDLVTSDITKINANDLGIVDTDKYCYIMTYSFPCQDLSLAGKQKGMAKGENTRSGLLWEVERLLNECTELPQILLMENVTQVHGTKNKEHFDEWLAFLESKGYKNYWKDLNAKNFGIPQNRNRCFMVSVLGEYSYEFPEEFPLALRLKDMLEDSVDEKFYLSNKMINYLHDITKKNVARGNGNIYSPADVDDCSKCITTKEGQRVKDNFIEEPVRLGYIPYPNSDKAHQSNTFYDVNAISPTLDTCEGGNRQVKIAEPQDKFIVEDFYKNRGERVYEDVAPTLRSERTGLKVAEPQLVGGIGEKSFGSQYRQGNRIYDSNAIAMSLMACPTGNAGGNSYLYQTNDLRVRKLTPKECWRLMGFDDADFDKAAQHNSNTQLYKQAGNSIVVDVLCYIFKQML